MLQRFKHRSPAYSRHSGHAYRYNTQGMDMLQYSRRDIPQYIRLEQTLQYSVRWGFKLLSSVLPSCKDTLHGHLQKHSRLCMTLLHSGLAAPVLLSI